MTADYGKPFGRSFWVIPGKFLAGCYPGSKDLVEASEKLHGLLSCGIRFVVNLMEQHERDHNGDRFIPYEEQLKRMGNEALRCFVWVIRREPSSAKSRIACAEPESRTRPSVASHP